MNAIVSNLAICHVPAKKSLYSGSICVCVRVCMCVRVRLRHESVVLKIILSPYFTLSESGVVRSIRVWPIFYLGWLWFLPFQTP